MQSNKYHPMPNSLRTCS